MGARRRQRIGVMIPSTNTTCEADFNLVLPDAFSVHGQRLWMTNEGGGADAYERMNQEVGSAARYLGTAKVDVVAYGCAMGSVSGKGSDVDMLALIEREASAPAVATTPAVVEALRALGARRISLATPYPEWKTLQLKRHFEAQGIEVLNAEGDPRAAAAGNQEINDELPESVAQFAAKVCQPQADALVCACTAWRSVEAVDDLERATGKPVVTANQAMIWAALRALHVNQSIKGFGRLLEEVQ